MRRSRLFILGGAAAGFAGVLGFHGLATAPAATPAAAQGGSSAAQSGTGAAGGAGTSSGSAAGGGTVRSATGTGVAFGFGTIAIRVTITGNRITNVSVASIHAIEPTSQQISSQAIPVLRAEVLSAQGASIHAVSGATYTSNGYVKSLQSALDQLNFK